MSPCTYTRVDGRVLDISKLADSERAYFDKAAVMFLEDAAWAEFCQLTYASANPAIEQGRATARTVESPLFLALLDMEWRLGVGQGCLTWTEALTDDPFADQWISVSDAADAAGVTRAAVYQAAARGILISGDARPTVISANSLKGWSVNGVRQRAGRHLSGVSA